MTAAVPPWAVVRLGEPAAEAYYGRFVHDQDGGVAAEGSCDGDALPFAAGEVVASPPGAGQ